MEEVYLIGSFFALSTAVTIITYNVLDWIWFKPKKLEKLLRQQGFNGNPYRLYYGDLKETGELRRIALSIPMNTFSNAIAPRASPISHQSALKHGGKWFVWFGQRPVVGIRDPETVREILSKHYDFHKPPGSEFDRLLAKGLASLEEEAWAVRRKLINPAFHLHKLKNMVPSFCLSCDEMLSKWDQIVANEGGGGDSSSCEVDVWPYIETMTSDVIARTAFGSSYEEGRKVFQLQKEQAQRIMEAAATLKTPGYRFLPTKLNKKVRETVKEVETALLGIIKKRMKALTEGDSGTRSDDDDDNDLLGLLLESNMKEMKERGDEFGMSMKEVMEECKLFYFAGQETIASLLIWTIILLSNHPDWQARARHEVLQLGQKPPDYHHLNHLKIVSMILQEVLRLYPPVAELGRFAHGGIRSLGGLDLPAGVGVMLPVLSMHHDAEFWGDDAEEFRPERFSGGVPEAAKKAYLPFGWGPRICIGQNFAMLEAKMAVAMILRSYSFELSPAYVHAPHSVITLQPQYGAHLILTKL